MVKLNLKGLLVFLTILFVLVAIWNDPTQTAELIGDFLGDVGNFLLDVIDVFTEFIQGLSS